MIPAYRVVPVSLAGSVVSHFRLWCGAHIALSQKRNVKRHVTFDIPMYHPSVSITKKVANIVENRSEARARATRKRTSETDAKEARGTGSERSGLHRS